MTTRVSGTLTDRRAEINKVMVESTMQYLVSLSDRTIEQLIHLEKQEQTGRDHIIAKAINYYYHSNPSVIDRQDKVIAPIFPKAMRYRVVEAISRDVLEHEVNKLTKSGWLPLGSVEYSRSTQWIQENKYLQAMTRENYEREE
jgi:hypothetical protein